MFPSHEIFASVPVDRVSFPQAKLDISERVRTNPLPWKGQFSPQLVEALLTAYAPNNSVIFDPFVGSGTSLVEAARLKLSSSGGEINPAAVILSRVYQLINLDASERATVLDQLRERLLDMIGPFHEPLFFHRASKSVRCSNLEAALVQVWRESSSGPMRDLVAALVVLCDFYRGRLDAVTIRKSWSHLDRLVRSLPLTTEPITVYHSDARALPIDSHSVDLVLTSPPYINVHNYHQKFRRSVEALGWDVLAIARSEIGSNRQNRANRFLTVIQYSLDMTLALREMVRVTKHDGRLILVLGRESSVQGIPFLNGGLVTELAVRSVGISIERRQERMFRNRYGSAIYEDILHFRIVNEVSNKDSSLTAARNIAREALAAASSIAARKERLGIRNAIMRVDAVSPSPMALSPSFE